MKKSIVSISLIAFLFFGCEEIFYETDISEENIEILAPTDNVELTAGIQTFSWKPVVGADSYLIQIATPSFENATQIVLDSTTTKTTVTKELTANSYQWRVRAKNAAYETNFTTYNFTVIN